MSILLLIAATIPAPARVQPGIGDALLGDGGAACGDEHVSQPQLPHGAVAREGRGLRRGRGRSLMYFKVDVAYRLGHVHAQHNAVDARVLYVCRNRQRLRHDGKAEPPAYHAAARAHLHLHAGFGRYGKHAAAKYAVG